MQSTPSKAPGYSQSSDLSFEDALTGLQDMVARLESGALSLEETIATFRQGSELAAHCQRMIAGAELRITEIANDPEQNPAVEHRSTQRPV